MSETVEAAGIAGVGAVIVLSALFAAQRLVSVSGTLSRAVSDRSVRRLLIALTLSLVSVIAINTIATGGPGSSISFAQAGSLRYVVAPVVYGSFAVIVLLGHGRSTAKAPWPFWAILLTFVLIISCFLAPMSGARFSIGTLVQGVTLAGGFVLFYVAGTRAVRWDHRSRTIFLALVLGLGAGSSLLGLNTGLFSALVVPAAIGLLYLALRGAPGWPVFAAAGVFILVTALVQNGRAIDPSDAQYAQIGIGAMVLVFASLPRGLRLPLAVISAIAGTIELARSSILPLMVGIGADQSDVTLAQRAYETEQVFAAIAHSPLTLLFGTGPGGTVDLSAAPDASTLLSSGRVLDAVPTVHLLSSYLLLKFGAAGVVILTALVTAMIREAVATLRERRPDAFRVVLVLLVFTGLAQAVPAATFLFSNPLPALALGLLAGVRTRSRSAEMSTRTSPMVVQPPTDVPRSAHRLPVSTDSAPVRIISTRGRHAAGPPTD